MIIFGFITIRQCIFFWVVEQAFVSLTPWETLGANSQIIIFYEFGTWLMVIFLMAQISVQRA